ncbi:MAG: hypothetical protein R3E09_04805 [Novosphingobium sp.]|nr:hypothetical protein [Novosphingobium sp.]
MTGFYFTLLAVLLAGLAARDQLAVAGLTLRQGARPGVLATGIAISIATGAAAAWAGSLVAPMLASNARLFLAAIALGLAGGESLLLSPGRNPEEPTLSLGALALVLVARQLTDAVRFLVFAVAVATNAPIPAGLGGAIGGAALLAVAWFAPEFVTLPLLRRLRRLVGAVLLLVALITGLNAIGFM